MTAEQAAKNDVFKHFGTMLEYPEEREGLIETTRACSELLREISEPAAKRLRFFEGFLVATSGEQLKEIYSSAFDLDPIFKIYVGFHLFGESYKRSQFLVQLNEHFRLHGIDVKPELPDHLSRVLALCGRCDHETFRGDLIEEGVRPAVLGMLGKNPEAESAAKVVQEAKSLEDLIHAERENYWPNRGEATLPSDDVSDSPYAGVGAGIATPYDKDAIKQGVLLANEQRARPSENPCAPCPLAGPGVGLGTQLKGVPEMEREKELEKEEVQEGEQDRLNHPYTNALFALEEFLKVALKGGPQNETD